MTGQDSGGNTVARAEAERVARAFHEMYERLAPFFGYETRHESAVPWESVPLMNKQLMIATCAEVLGELVERERNLAQALTDLLDTVERGDEFAAAARTRAARDALKGAGSG